MPDIAGFPYFEVQFTKEGTIHDTQEVQRATDGIAAGTFTDLFVFSHGWNNDLNDARQLYRNFFASVRSLLDAGTAPKLTGRKFAVLGVLWPSKKFADRELIPSGAASAASPITDEIVNEQLERLKEALDTPEASVQLDEASALLPELEFDPAAREAFVEKVRSLLPPPGEDEEVAGEFFTLPGDEVMAQLSVPLTMPSAPADPDDASGGGAVGFRDFFSGAKAAAQRVLNYATYYVMKGRAGTVGSGGLAKMLAGIKRATPNVKVHLIGHSFGARVVTAAAHAIGGDPATRPASMSLLQAAFSHNAFATKFDGKRDGFFRGLVSGKKVAGAIVITHTKNDRAVGTAYPIASKLARQDAAALGDENDRFGGLGRNGAIGKFTPEAQAGTLQGVGASYAFSAGKLFNLEASAFIKDHGDVAGKEVAAAVLSAVAAS